MIVLRGGSDASPLQGGHDHSRRHHFRLILLLVKVGGRWLEWTLVE